MTTATADIDVDEKVREAFSRDVDEMERSQLDAPAGVFKVRLVGNVGRGQSSGGAFYSNLRFLPVAEALYDPETGIKTGEEREVRGRAFFYKYYVTKGEAKGGGPNEYAIRQLDSWFTAVDYSTKGELDPKTGRYKFDIDEALSSTIDREAWVVITHKKDGEYGWKFELSDFSKKPRYRIKVEGN